MPRRFLVEWVRRMARVRPFSSVRDELVVIFVDPAEMKRLNKRYRSRHYATDVLSFEGAGSFGELVICPQVIRAQARDTGLTFREELGYMIIHGGLHLLGYDHETSGADAKRMFALQDRIFAKLVPARRELPGEEAASS